MRNRGACAEREFDPNSRAVRTARPWLRTPLCDENCALRLASGEIGAAVKGGPGTAGPRLHARYLVKAHHRRRPWHGSGAPLIEEQQAHQAREGQAAGFCGSARTKLPALGRRGTCLGSRAGNYKHSSVASSCNERVFSAWKHIMGDKRTRLGSKWHREEVSIYTGSRVLKKFKSDMYADYNCDSAVASGSDDSDADWPGHGPAPKPQAG